MTRALLSLLGELHAFSFQSVNGITEEYTHFAPNYTEMYPIGISKRATLCSCVSRAVFAVLCVHASTNQLGLIAMRVSSFVFPVG